MKNSNTDLTKYRFLAYYVIGFFAILLLLFSCNNLQNLTGNNDNILIYEITAQNQEIKVHYFNGIQFDFLTVTNETKQIFVNIDFFDAKIKAFNPDHFSGNFDLYPVIDNDIFIELKLYFNGIEKCSRVGKYNAMIEVYRSNETTL